MAAFDFPASPFIGQVYLNYIWDGEKWTVPSPALMNTGVPDAPVDGQVYARQGSTSSWVLVTQPATIAPLMDGTATIGSVAKYAREDHIHPFDTSRLSVFNPNFTGTLSESGTAILGHSSGYTVLRNGDATGGLVLGGAADPNNYHRNRGHFFQNLAGSATSLTIDTTANTAVFTGAVYGQTPTPSSLSNTQLATTAFVQALVGSGGGGGITLADPSTTAKIGMTATGTGSVITTAMRSNSGLAIDPAIAPTWTGNHLFYAAGRTGSSAPALAQVLNVQIPNESVVAAPGFFLPVTVGLNRNGGTGHREAMHVTITGANAPLDTMNVGAQFAAYDISGSGDYFGLNSWSGAYAASGPWLGADPSTQICSFEANTLVEVAHVVRKVGIQIVDVAGSVGSGTVFDTGIIIGCQPGGVGYSAGIRFGFLNADNEFGIYSGGTLIGTSTNNVVLSSGLNLSGLVGGFSTSAIVLPASNAKGIYWGSSKQGGSLVSETSSNGPDIVYGSNVVLIRKSGTDIARFNAAGDTYLIFNFGGSAVYRRLICGAVDSAGAGFRTVKIEN